MRRRVELGVLAAIYGTMTVVALVVVALIITHSNDGGDKSGGEARTVPHGTPRLATNPDGTFVVVASRDIAYGNRVEARGVEIAEVPRAKTATGAYSDIVQVVGQYAIRDIGAGEQVRPSDIAPFRGYITPTPSPTPRR